VGVPQPQSISNTISKVARGKVVSRYLLEKLILLILSLVVGSRCGFPDPSLSEERYIDAGKPI
jgi:hypothetical protein